MDDSQVNHILSLSTRWRQRDLRSAAGRIVLGPVLLALWWIPASAAPNAAHSRQLPDFSYTQGWLGADGAYSVSLGPDKSVWLFGDTFVANPDTKLRSQYRSMVRNSIGISECKPAEACRLLYLWQKANLDKPRSFFDTGSDDVWYWPLDGYRDGKTLFVALLAVRNKPGAGPEDAFGFAIVGTKLATIDNPEILPQKWHVSIQDLTDARLWAGTSLVPDGNYVLWYTQVRQSEARGYMTVMRLLRGKMANPVGSWEYLREGGRWATGLAGDDAERVIDQPISEMSVRYHPSIHRWLALSTGPEFPSPRAVVRSADSPIGPWSSAQTIYEFPEMKPQNPGYDKDTFCYAVKEHTEFTETKLALTYACNSMVVAKTIRNMNIYRPRVVILDLPNER